MENETNEKFARTPVGNAAALREALREAIGETCAGCKRDCEDCMNLKSGWMKKAKAALSKPPRNCDRFNTLDEARQSYQIIRGHAVWADVELWDNKDEIGLFVRWLFAPAAERKGAGE